MSFGSAGRDLASHRMNPQTRRTAFAKARSKQKPARTHHAGRIAWHAFVISYPASIAVAEVGQVRSEQAMNVIIRQCPLQRLESNLLQDHVPVRIGQDLLLDSITALVAGIDQLV